VAIWLVRSGKYGEHESRFIEDGKIYLTWDGLGEKDLSVASDYQDIKRIVEATYPDERQGRLNNWSGQIWAFALAMQPGDWVVMPSKMTATIAVGEIVGAYSFVRDAEPHFHHRREVRWINAAVPRNSFDQDLLYSMGAFLTVCQIQRNDAERRIRMMATGGWTTRTLPAVSLPAAQTGLTTALDEEQSEVDLEQLATDSIAKLIIQRFQGHGMALLVDAVLRAQGFTTYRSPEGADKGIDILAAGGPFGFAQPKICVQVKSGDAQADRPEFTQLIGAMQSVGAEHGLFVSWSGFKPTVLRELPGQFFKVRVWTGKQLVDQLLANYDKLDQDIRSELPLKRIWTLAHPDD